MALTSAPVYRWGKSAGQAWGAGGGGREEGGGGVGSGPRPGKAAEPPVRQRHELHVHGWRRACTPEAYVSRPWMHTSAGIRKGRAVPDY